MDGVVDKPARVLVISTGGTIGMADVGNGYEPVLGFMEKYCRKLAMFHDPEAYDPEVHGPGLLTGVSKFGKRIYYEIYEYNPVLDSSDMGMGDWTKIASDIERFYNDWDAFVVLHGTDTMAYTASALSYMLQDLGKTVVVTGSQVPMVEQRNDGQANFQGALLIAGHYTVPEVTLYFHNNLYRGNRTTKAHATSLSAFDSPNLPPLMKLGIKVDVDWDAIHRPTGVKQFSVQKKMDPNVCILRLFPGIKAELVEHFCQPPIRGVVLQSYGAGNAPERKDILDQFKAASDRGVLIVNTTQCHGGFVEAAYRSGQILLKAGVLPGGDMTPESALTKLSYVLGNDDLDYEAKKEMLLKNIRGERMVATEQEQFSFGNKSFLHSITDALNVSSAAEIGMIKSALAPVLLCSAAQNGDVEWITKLDDDGYDVNSKNSDNRTALHIAAAEGHEASLDLLLTKGASVHALDRFGKTPLNDAIAGTHLEIIKVLRECGANLKHMDPHDVGTIMCKNAFKDDVEALEAWIAAGVDVNATDYDGRTALHVAAAQGSSDTSEILLEQPNIDTSKTDISGLTASEEARRMRSRQTVMKMKL
jgi:lysophospholipase